MRRYLRKVRILYPVSLYFHETSYKCSALNEVTVFDRKNKCLVIESRLLIDKNEYSLDEILIAVDSDGKCYLNAEDEKPLYIFLMKSHFIIFFIIISTLQ